MLNGQIARVRSLEGHKHNVVRPTPIVSLQPLPAHHLAGACRDTLAPNVWMFFLTVSPLAVSAEGLKEYFCKFGEVKECMVMRDPVTKRSR